MQIFREDVWECCIDISKENKFECDFMENVVYISDGPLTMYAQCIRVMR